MYVKMPYDLYQKIKHEEGVEQIELFDECLREEIEFSLDALDVTDDNVRKEIAESAYNDFIDYGDLTESLYDYITDKLGD